MTKDQTILMKPYVSRILSILIRDKFLTFMPRGICYNCDSFVVESLLLSHIKSLSARNEEIVKSSGRNTPSLRQMLGMQEHDICKNN